MRRNPSVSVQAANRLAASKRGRPSQGNVFDDLSRLGDLVECIYTLERRMQESGLTERPSAYTAISSLDRHAANLEVAPRQPVWMKIARFLAGERIGPLDYIARQFDQCRSLAKPLYPNELLGAAAWKRYIESKATKQEDLKLQLRSYRSSLASNDGLSAYVVWSTSRANRDTTVESYLSALYCEQALSPLFVYCVAVDVVHNHQAYEEDAAKLVHRFEVQAAVEYVRFRSEYDSAWGELIPLGFRGKAEEIYRNLLGKLF